MLEQLRTSCELPSRSMRFQTKSLLYSGISDLLGGLKPSSLHALFQCPWKQKPSLLVM